MDIRIFQVDAFASKLFEGNPAAVCPLVRWPEDSLMQSIAAENNLSETAFLVQEQGWQIRWFTPTSEIDLCGHATLAAAHVLFRHMGVKTSEIRFGSRSGVLKVKRDGDLLTLDFPRYKLVPAALPHEAATAFGQKPLDAYRYENKCLVLVMPDVVSLSTLMPDMRVLVQLPYDSVCITAKGEKVDFVSRFFAPKMGIDEDPVTGSLYTHLAPFWAQQLNKVRLETIQFSGRGEASVKLELKLERVLISGRAKTYMVGSIMLGDTLD